MLRNQSLVAPSKDVKVECKGLQLDWESAYNQCLVTYMSWFKIVLWFEFFLDQIKFFKLVYIFQIKYKSQHIPVTVKLEIICK